MPSDTENAPLDAVRVAAEQIARDIADGPILPDVTASEIRTYLESRYDFTAPRPLHEVTRDVERMLRRWQVHVTHPRYFGLFNPSVTPASVVGDTLTAAYNPQLATWRTSPAANEIERHTLQWLARKFGLPPQASASFTTGGAEANLSAVIAALTSAFPEYGERGLRRADANPAIYLTSEAHHSFNKIAHMTGVGRDALHVVEVGKDLRMDLAVLANRVAADLRAGFKPLMVVGTAGTTGAGAIDPLPELADFCQSEGLWFHVDAAWGGAAIVSPRLAVHLAGIERADSITCDAHKWFSVPMGAGMFFCRHPQIVDAAFHAETSYMPARAGAGARDPYTSSVQWSRRFIGLKLFMALAERGERGYAAMIDHQARMGDLLRQRLARSGWRIANETPLPLVCFTRDGLDPTRYLAELTTRQIAWMSEVRLRGTSVLRACVTSFMTSESDVEWVVREMDSVVRGHRNDGHES
ncbi:MAG TPA: pyridoxal-dependent decarboxylase [Vicinamibacterales bacterium]